MTRKRGKPVKKPVERRPGEVLNTAEVLRVLGFCGTGAIGKRNRALIVLMWRTGLRCSEALSLRSSDFDLERKTVLVRAGKGNKTRRVFYDPFVVPYLEAWLEYRRVEGLQRAPVFCRIKGGAGKPMTTQAVRSAFKRLSQKLGRRIHPHALRHSFAFDIANEGKPAHAVKTLLGHESLETTTRYLDHIGAGELARIMHGRPPPEGT